MTHEITIPSEPVVEVTSVGGTPTDTFNYNFKHLEESHVKVYVDGALDATAVVTGVALGDGSGFDGGQVVLTAPVSNVELVIARETAITRTSDIGTGGLLPIDTINNELDTLVAIAMEQSEELDRSIKLKRGDTGGVIDTRLPVLVANRGIKINATADGFDMTDNDLDAVAAAAAASAAAALASENAAAASQAQADLERQYAAEWANKAEDSLVSADAGGDEVDDYSALHWAEKAADSAAAAAASAAGAGLPSITIADVGNRLEVNSTGTGYDSIDVSGSSGNIGDPILSMPMRHDLMPAIGYGSASFTRASVATYVDRSGVLQTAAVNEPRFEADGLLIEGAGTNQMLYSEQLDDASWTKLQATISADAAAAPTGVSTADKIVEDSSSNLHGIRSAVFGALTPNAKYSFSLFAKAAGRDNLRVDVYNSADWVGSSNVWAKIDIATGAIDGSFNCVADVISLADDWFRITMTMTAEASPGSAGFVDVKLDDSVYTGTYLGDGSSGAYVWGLQFEEQAFATSYIPSVAVAGTRADETALLTFDNNLPKSGNDYTVLIDGSLLGNNGADQEIFTVDGEVSRLIGVDSSLLPFFKDGATASVVGAVALSAGYRHRIGARSSGTDLAVFLDGVQGGVGTYTTTSGAPTAIRLGSRATSLSEWYGHIKNLRIYDVALTNQEMRVA